MLFSEELKYEVGLCFYAKPFKLQREKSYFLTCAPTEKSTRASTQSDRSLRCPHEEFVHPWQPKYAPEDPEQARKPKLI